MDNKLVLDCFFGRERERESNNYEMGNCQISCSSITIGEMLGFEGTDSFIDIKP